MFGQFGSKKNPCNMRFMHYHSMHYDNFYCSLLNLYLPALVCVEDQRREEPNYLHKVTSWYVCQAYQHLKSEL